MNWKKRLLAGLLSLVMALSLCPACPVHAADSAGSGSVGVTIRFDLPQTKAAVDSRDLTVSVTGRAGTLVLPLKDGTPSANPLQARAAVEAKNTDGVLLTTESRIGSYEAVVSGLPAGNYTLTVSGSGYVTYTSILKLENYAQHVIIGTGDGTLALGDVDGDGNVDEDDLDALSAYLGRTEVPAKYDLNGDGRVDVTDLTYINYLIGQAGKAEILSTASMVLPAVDKGSFSLTGGSETDLFSSEKTVTLRTTNPTLTIPMTFPQAVNMQEIVITSPDGAGAVQAGVVEVETDGGTERYPFDIAAPENVRAIGPKEGERTVTIDLGRKTAVKKVTVTVTKVSGQTGKEMFAAVTKIEFLQDIVPTKPVADASQVTGLRSVSGNGQVELVWNAVRNVTGYTVRYGQSENALTQTLSVNNCRATVTGLENLKTYYFQVFAVNGDWRGTGSAVISASPRPSSAPGAPSNIRVEAGDGCLRLGWGKTKDAAFYQVFYREKGSGSFLPSGGNLTATSAAITGLTNGTTYEVAVKAGNDAGVGPYSATAQGTPAREVIALPELPTDGRIPASTVTNVVLTNANNVDRTLCPNFSTKHLLDSDAATCWVARAWWESSEITYTFDKPQDMNYLVLVPYLGGRYKNALKTYSITAKDAAGNTLLSGSYRAPAMTDKNYLVLPFQAVKGVKSLSVSLAEWEGNGCRVSVSEMAFYRSDALPDDIAGLFADSAFTQLRSGVTEAQIDALESRLAAKTGFYLDQRLLQDELSLARKLLKGQDGLGTVRTGFQSRSAGQDSQYGQSASALQPLGISVLVPSPAAGASARTPVAIYAQLPADAPVYVVPTQYFGESGIWQGSAIPLTEGRNYIDIPQIGSLTDPRGGPLYLTYAGSHPEQIKLHIRAGGNVKAVPVLELSGWYDMSEDERTAAISAYVEELGRFVPTLSGNLETNVYNTTDISTPSVLLSLPANKVLEGLRGVNSAASAETMYQTILAWEDVLLTANKVQGIVSSSAAPADYRYPMTTRQNIRYMRMFAGAFMYAAGSHIGIGYGSAAALVQGQPVSQTGPGRANRLFGWGISHEIGHNMDKLGKAEITNNIYALAVQANDGGSMTLDTRLTASGVWQRVYDKVSAGRPGAASDVFLQLGMYWQLHLAYDDGEDPLAFYNQFFRLWKAGEYKSYSYDERVALTAAKTANRDLTAFFTRWGMTLSDSVKAILAKYPAEDRAIWYLNDASRTYRLSGGEAAPGTVSLQTAVRDNTVTLTLQSTGASGLLGYEISRNGVPIAFTTSGTFTDDLGAANNLAYTYSAVPVDQLGQSGPAAEAASVRIAYDKAIPASSYTVTGTNPVVFTMKSDSAAVTGIKVTGSGLQGSFTVKLKAKATDTAWTTVKTGTLSGASTVAYFTKPGAPAGDTRIWTYDAAIVQVEGVPSGAAVELLDYPGDRIDFYEGATAGYLTEDYVYPGGKIPAKTLVILGSYRGDPVYNTVEIQARYSTTAEGQELPATIERAMNGYTLLLAEVPDDGEVSDLSDGIFIFVPDLEAEKALNQETGVTAELPFAIRALLYRTDTPQGTASDTAGSTVSRRLTSETLWISCPDSETSISLQSSK